MQNIRSVLGPILHVCFLSHHFYTVSYSSNLNRALENFAKTDHRIMDIKNWSAVFFTNWNLLIQITYFAVAVLYDVLDVFSLFPKLKNTIDKWKGFLFTSFVFPLSTFVFAMFWSVYNIDRELVFPEVVDEFLPPWFNHSLHTSIMVYVIIEVFVANQLLPSFKTAFTALTVLTVIYNIVFFYAYFVIGRFVYDLWNVLNWPQRIVFVFANYLSTIIFMQIGISIEKFKYGLEKSKVKKL